MGEPAPLSPAAPGGSRRERRQAGVRRSRRRAGWLAAGVAVVVVAVAGGTALVLAAGSGSGRDGAVSPPRAGTSRPKVAATTAPATTVPVSSTTTTFPSQHVPEGPPTDTRHLSVRTTIGGDIAPKSVAASGTGLVFAQNMMYRHSVTVYDAAGNLVKTIPDSVDLAQFGVVGGASVQGAPVEAAFTRDALNAYVSNYAMYGPGQGPEGSDECTPESARAAGNTPSYVYRIATWSLAVDQVIPVGMVPKFVATTPDGRYVLVTNWCSWDLHVIDAAQGQVVAVLPMGRYPRGVAVHPDSRTAYIALMGDSRVVKVDLTNLTVAGSFDVGVNPRHLVIDPAGRFLYASLNQAGRVVKIDLANEQVAASVHTGDEARSLAIAADGRSLYVVNYASHSVTKLRADDLAVLQDVPVGEHPIGIAYEPTTGDVWVALYSGQILVFADT
jgi:YVTN family beta-propeller protein